MSHQPSDGQMPALRVVVADSQPAFRAGVALALHGHGFVIVAEARTAEGAVDAVGRERPDICLMDVAVPGSGILAARQIAVDAPRTAVVILTSLADITEVFASWRAGAVGYLEKSIAPARLPLMLAAVAMGEAVLLPRELTARLTEAFHNRTRGERRHPMVGRRQVVLTDREWDVADLLCADLTTAQIAARLGLAEATVRRHISEITHKLEAADRVAARQVLAAAGQQA